MLIDGELRYVVSISVTADFDGFLPEVSDPEAEMERVLSLAETRCERSLSAEVHDELAFLLCAHCHGRWLDNPLGVPRRHATGASAFLH